MEEFKVGEKVKYIGSDQKSAFSGEPIIIADKIYEITKIYSQEIVVKGEYSKNHDENYNYCISANQVEKVESVKEEKMEEFKVDKLGSYECVYIGNDKDIAEENINIQITYIDKAGECVGLFDDGQIFSIFLDNGIESRDEDYKLTKYLGPELPKKPREFEFVGKILDYNSPFGAPCIVPDEKKSFTIEEVQNSKWQVTMKEIIDE